MLEIVSTEKKITLAFDGLTQSYPLGSLACEYTDNGVSIFTDDKVRIYTAPMSQTTVNGTQLTPDNAADLLDSLFKSGSDGGGSLPIEITDVNGLQAELDTIVTNKILYENEYNALSQAEKDDPSISYFIIEPPLRAFLEQVALDGGIIEDATALVASYLALTPQQKASDLVLLPGAYKEGYVYGIKSDGKYEKLPFTRGSAGTRFDSNLNMQLISPNIPRIDYGNYSASTKLLMEKESTNINSDSELRSITIPIQSERVNVNWFNQIERGVLMKREDSDVYLNCTGTVPYDRVYSFSCFIVNKTNESSLTISATNTGDIWVSPNNVANYKQNIVNNNIRILSFNVTAATGTGKVGLRKRTNGLNSQIECSGFQLEEGTNFSSYIPTTDRAETRSADSLSINLSANSTIYIKTVKEEKTITKSAGVWNVQDDILESDGIQLITIKYN